MRGVNAAVVGLLGAALYNPLWTSSVKSPGDFGLALVGFVLLTVWRLPPLVVVIVSAIGRGHTINHRKLQLTRTCSCEERDQPPAQVNAMPLRFSAHSR
jgi:chromate transport protein ChrA